jgi:hypothetical protein
VPKKKKKKSGDDDDDDADAKSVDSETVDDLSVRPEAP